MSKSLIGNGVVNTDDVIEQGYDFVGLKMAGMLKVQEETYEQDLTIAGTSKYRPPGYVSDLAFTTDLPATKEGDSPVALTVAVEKGVAPYTYKWYRGSTVISGATTASYNATQSGSYKVEVTDADQNEITSTVCVVSVFAAMAFTTNLATTHPDVYLGNSETFGPFTVAATGGKAPLTYQWKRATANVATGATFGPVNVDDVFPSNGSYNWSCVVTDARGTSITSNIMPAAAYRLPSFTTQPPATLSVATGAAIAINTTPATTSKPARTYQWYKDGSAVSGQTAANFTKAAAVAGDAGTYYVIMTDANGKTVQSTNTVLTIT
ncbi:head outer capsid protein [Kosakonia phage Kc283]|uniref:Head outer capsid protein n=1 Tax=Kosakonia phage Kc283 TaxID=2863195 RepID=A0AAE7WHU7_9CAUD|nr:Hoc-like head decoration [Kosakonia phage Kc283]QYN79849.1 head outer capsid protein [Kosakonia phage Kc283]